MGAMRGIVKVSDGLQEYDLDLSMYPSLNFVDTLMGADVPMANKRSSFFPENEGGLCSSISHEEATAFFAMV
jgi:hypothetical protein